jgi:hypothetical protein
LAAELAVRVIELFSDVEDKKMSMKYQWLFCIVILMRIQRDMGNPREAREGGNLERISFEGQPCGHQLFIHR